MPSYLFIHPIVSAFAGLFILMAFFTKKGKRAYFFWHYLAGTLGVIIIITTIGVALWAGGQYFETTADTSNYSIFIPHRFLAFSVFLAVILQGITGWVLFFSPRATKSFIRWHKWFAYSITGLVLTIGALGLVGMSTLLEIVSKNSAFIIVGILVIGVPFAFYSWMKSRAAASRANVRVVREITRPVVVPPKPVIHYSPDNKDVETSVDESILQTSLNAGIPHTHVCGGNARCSTCRVMILQGLENCAPRNRREQAMADKLGFGNNIRLACQTRLVGDVRLRRLVLDEDDIVLTSQVQEGVLPGMVGIEKNLAILFTDIRGFTSFAEALPPYDVVHALNRYYQKIGGIIKRNGGEINNYMGDGLLAVFDSPDAHEAVYHAIRAGVEMLGAVEEMKPYFQASYGRTIEIGIGIHYGEAVIGHMGAPGDKRHSVIGDAINFASRVENATKIADTNFLISEFTLGHVRDHVDIGKQISVELKGKQGEFRLHEIVGLKNLHHD